MTIAQQEIRDFLAVRYGPIDALEPLQPSGWSRAFAFRARRRDLILRLGRYREDFEKECIAADWQTPGVPIPDVLEMGTAFAGFYIVSQRHEGTKLADLPPHRVPAAIASLFDVLARMREIALPGTGFGIWLAPSCDAPYASWTDYLRSLPERDELRLSQWRSKLAAQPSAQEAFQRGHAALCRTTTVLPNTRALVHADLLLNHLVDPANRIATVFDWGNAIAGDPLYDVAWILYCIPWFPAISSEQVRALAKAHFGSEDLDRRLALYQLHIALASLQYLAHVDDTAEMHLAVQRIGAMLRALEN